MELGFNFEASVTKTGAKTVRRALTVLKAFTDPHPIWTLTGLASHLGLSKATTHRFLTALEEEGFLQRNRMTGEYRLGSEAIVLGAQALRAVDFREIAREEIESLARTTGEDTSLESLVGSQVLILDEARGNSLLRIPNSIGTLWPAHATATGKVLLAFSDSPPPVKTGGLSRLTDKTIDSWTRLSEVLEEVRNQGYATNVEELEPGYVAIAAPIRNRVGQVVAAISVGGSVHRIPVSRLPELASQVSSAARRISERMGFGRGPKPGLTRVTEP